MSADLISRKAVLEVIENYRVPVGNSAAGEMACEWTTAALREIRDEIAEIAPQQPAAMDGATSMDAHKATLTSLVAAVSLLRGGGRKAAPSDAMFNMMLADYKKAIEASRIALSGQQQGGA